MKTVKLLGAMGRRFGRIHRLDVATPAEAFRALCALFPDFRPAVLEAHTAGVGWRVATGRHFLSDYEQARCHSSEGVFVFAPVVIGRGGGGTSGLFGAVLLGIGLIAVSFIPGLGPGLAMGLRLAGAGMALNGVAAMLTPTPKMPSDAKGDDVLKSSLFTRNQETLGQGEAVPICYGQRRIRGARMISFRLTLTGDRDIELPNDRRGHLGYVNDRNL